MDEQAKMVMEGAVAAAGFVGGLITTLRAGRGKLKRMDDTKLMRAALAEASRKLVALERRIARLERDRDRDTMEPCQSGQANRRTRTKPRSRS
jgi:hypothetical protein